MHLLHTVTLKSDLDHSRWIYGAGTSCLCISELNYNFLTMDSVVSDLNNGITSHDLHLVV